MKNSFEMYNELISMGPLNEDIGHFRDDEIESFITEDEILKLKEDKKRPFAVPRISEEEQESIHFKRFNKNGRRYESDYPESERIRVRESCVYTIVHDYSENDWYHITNEERTKTDQLSEINLKLACLRRTYRRVDQYIEAMRIVFEAWSILARKNYLHDRDEFFDLVFKGKIVSNRIIMPKLKRMETYNLDMLVQYISQPRLDVSHLVPKTDRFVFDDSLDDRTIEEEFLDTFSIADMQHILELTENPSDSSIKATPFKYKYVKGYDKRNYQPKNEIKKDRKIRESLAPILRKVQNGAHYREQGRSFMVYNSMFTRRKKPKSIWDEIKFNASWSDNLAVRLYDLVINDELMKQYPPGEKYATYGDLELQEFYRILDSNGLSSLEWSRFIGSSKDDFSRQKNEVETKHTKKMESILVQRITKLNNNPKFKKIVKKAEEVLIKQRGERQ